MIKINNFFFDKFSLIFRTKIFGQSPLKFIKRVTLAIKYMIINSDTN